MYSPVAPNSYLSALAVCDSVVLTCSALLIGIPALPLHLVSQYVQGGPFAYVLAYVYPLALVAQTATVWLTVSFAVERYIGVQYPLRAVSVCTVQRARSVSKHPAFIPLFLMIDLQRTRHMVISSHAKITCK